MNTDITRGYGYLVPRKVLANWPHAIGQDHKSGLIQHWAGVMESCRRSSLPNVRADRLRTAAELRADLARELRA